MFFQHSIGPKALLQAIGQVDECFFTVAAKLPNRNYNIAIYKYDEDFFVLNDTRVFEHVASLKQSPVGDEDPLLSTIEISLEDNLYTLIPEELVYLDLKTLTLMKQARDVEIHYYEFIDV